MQDLENTIRERAYHLWAADGCRDGNAEAHWLVAQREVLEASLSAVAGVGTRAKATTAKKKTKTTSAKPRKKAA